MIHQSLANNTGMIKSPKDNPQVFISANIRVKQILGVRFTEVEAPSLLTTVTSSWQLRSKENTKSQFTRLTLERQILLLNLWRSEGGRHTHGCEALFIQKLHNMHASWQVYLLTQKQCSSSCRAHKQVQKLCTDLKTDTVAIWRQNQKEIIQEKSIK